MRILDRYIGRSIITIFIFCIFIFLFLYVVIDILTNLEDILKNKIDIILLAQYYAWSLPLMFIQVAPFTCLLSTLYTFGKLNHNSEIIAMRASGMSVVQIARTALLFGIVVTLTAFWVNDRIVPKALGISQKMKMQINEGIKKSKEKKLEDIMNLSMYGIKNRLFFITKFSPATNTMENITILEHDEKQNIIRKIVANRGEYVNNVWKFYQSITYTFDANGQVLYEPSYSEEEIMPFTETPQDFLNQRQRTEMMTSSELEDYIWKLSRSGATTALRNLRLELYQRFAFPFINLIIIILGIPFALKIRKRATGLSSMGLSIMVGFLYYILDAVCIALGKSGIVDPLLSVWLSHIIALSTGFYLISKLP